VDVEGLGFLFCELFLDGFFVFIDCRVIVILVPGWYIFYGTYKVSFEGDAFCEYTFASNEIRWRERFWGMTLSRGCKNVKGLVPISVAVGVFSTKPPDEVAVVEMET
jgi:hypothetical protein